MRAVFKKGVPSYDGPQFKLSDLIAFFKRIATGTSEVDRNIATAVLSFPAIGCRGLLNVPPKQNGGCLNPDCQLSLDTCTRMVESDTDGIRRRQRRLDIQEKFESLAGFRCIACCSANYCSAECQHVHWPMHKIECSKLKEAWTVITEHAPSAFEGEWAGMMCRTCGRLGIESVFLTTTMERKNFDACSRCKSAFYCGVECQRKD